MKQSWIMNMGDVEMTDMTDMMDMIDDTINKMVDAQESKIVLIIDDSEDICDAVRDILGEIGIIVITAHDGQQGLDLYLQYKDSVGIVLLDMVLPVLTGAEVLKELRVYAPTLPVVISSGYGDSAIAGHPDDPHLSFLSKPFSFDDLVAKVEAAVQ